ncbi:MAG: uracil-DNA glycosylase [Kiloniellales bacterium]
MGEQAEPAADCALCSRLAGYRADNRRNHPGFHNAPVPAFGPLDARLLIVGLAPGLKGANRTGRPFTGDYAGDLLYATLLKFGLAAGSYGRAREDGLTLSGCRITNTVRCVPPDNKPLPLEVRTCGRFLAAEIAALPRLRAVLALGTVAHGAVLAVRGARKSAYPFAHGARHRLDDGLTLADSYHCSRYNTNTGKLTREMFESVFAALTPLVAAR